jgi:hypothetical protein
VAREAPTQHHCRSTPVTLNGDVTELGELERAFTIKIEHPVALPRS